MRPLALLLLALPLALALAACDAAEVDPTPHPEVIPLEVGATWVLELAYTIRYRDGIAADTLRPASRPTVTLTVARDSLIGGERWFQLESSRASGLLHPAFCRTNEEWYANRDGGLYRIAEPGAAPELLFAASPPPGVPFIDTEGEAVALDDPAATYALPSLGAVEARRYARTTRHFSGVGAVPAGPIAPEFHTADHLSAEVGFVALDFPNIGPGAEAGTWVPSAVHRYELVSFERP